MGDLNLSRAKPKFFVGIFEIGDFVNTFTNSIRELGFEIESVVVERDVSNFKKSNYDRVISKNNKFFFGFGLIKEFLRSVFKYDIFIFTYGESFFSGRLHCIDLKILKALNKKIVFVCFGSDIRSYHRLIEDLRDSGYKGHAHYLQVDFIESEIIKGGHWEGDGAAKRRVIASEKYGDLILARPCYAHLLKKPYELFWPLLNEYKLKLAIRKTSRPLIVHAPSKRFLKGTTYVLDAVERLKEDGYEFDFELCENMSSEDVCERLEKSEIAIDQLLLPTHGVFAVEAMGSGNVVLGSVIKKYDGFDDSLPIVQTTPEFLYDDLKRLLEDPDRRMELAIEGMNYVQKCHNAKSVIEKYLECLT